MYWLRVELCVTEFVFANEKWVNALFKCLFCGCKASGVALEDSDMILCFVHHAPLFWKVLFTELSDELSFGTAVLNCVVGNSEGPPSL